MLQKTFNPLKLELIKADNKQIPVQQKTLNPLKNLEQVEAKRT